MFKLFMMEERRNPDSLWKDYLSVMPKDYSSFPPMYTDDEMIELDGSFFSKFVKEFKRAMVLEYSTISKKLPDFAETYTYAEFMETFNMI